jgi:ceramide glucosyltransferase
VSQVLGEAAALLQRLWLVPALGGAVYGMLCLAAVPLWRWRSADTHGSPERPPLSVLKPVHGLEKDLAENLRSLCRQSYPDYQVVLSVQRLDDPAIPLLYAVQGELGEERVTVVVGDSPPVVNGKVQNLLLGLSAARHDLLVISDSDVRAPSDYLETLVAPLADPRVGCACTLYRSVRAQNWFERIELLSINADFMPSVIFAEALGISDFCPGSTLALRRSTLAAIGGLESLIDYVVEDYELGRRIRAMGLKVVTVPYFVEVVVDFARPSQCWAHLVYWDQHTRAARPIGFAATVLTRSLPFALLFAATRLFDGLGLAVLAAALAIRLATAALILQFGLRDREGLRSLHWLPLRDLLGLASWLLALTRKTFVWRGMEFGLTRDGRIVPRELAP